MQILHELWTKYEEHGEIRPTDDYVINQRDKLDATMKIAQDNITRAHENYTFCYDATGATAEELRCYRSYS